MIVKILSLLTFFKIICFSDVDQDQGHQLELGKTLPVTREQNKNDSILGKSMEDEMRRVDRFDENEYEDEDGEDEDDEDEDEDDEMRIEVRISPGRGWYGQEVSKFVDLVVDTVSSHFRRTLRRLCPTVITEKENI